MNTMYGGLREFLQQELGDRISGIPLGALVAQCYRELLLRAGTFAGEALQPREFQRKLREIARELAADVLKAQHPPSRHSSPAGREGPLG